MMKRSYLLAMLWAFIVLCGTLSVATAAYQHAGKSDAPTFLAAYPNMAGAKLDSIPKSHPESALGSFNDFRGFCPPGKFKSFIDGRKPP